MPVAWFDAFSGLSGDMTIGACLDLGVPLAVLEAGLAPLGIGGYRIAQGTRERSGIRAVKFDVVLDATGAADDGSAPAVQPHDHGGHGHGHRHDDGHHHAHAHGDDDGHHHAHAHGDDDGHHHAHAHGDGHRHYREIRTLLDTAPLAEGVRRRAQAVFRALALAEGKVHGRPADEVAFHEVGAIDAIVDIVGAAICMEYLGIDQVYVSPLPLGSGFARSLHGVIPVPPPATAELLRGFPVLPWDGDRELVTPTGAAILAALARPGRPPGPFIPTAVGYGAGTRELADRPNLLRIVLGEIAPPADPAPPDAAIAARRTAAGTDGHAAAGTGPAPGRDEVVVLEANVDDMNPELFDPAIEALLAAGARDVSLSPITMKKGRPGTLLRVIASPADRDRLALVVLRHTSTIGVRFHPAERLVLPREERTVDTAWGRIRVKVVTLPDGTRRATPEFEDCRRAALFHDQPVATVYRAAAVAAAAAE